MTHAFCPAETMIEVPPGTLETELADHLKAIDNIFISVNRRESGGPSELAMGPDGCYQLVEGAEAEDRLIDLVRIKARHREIVVAIDTPILRRAESLCELECIPAGELRIGDRVVIRCGSKRDHSANGIHLGKWLAPRPVVDIEILPQKSAVSLFGLQVSPLGFYEANGFYIASEIPR